MNRFAPMLALSLLAAAPAALAAPAQITVIPGLSYMVIEPAPANSEPPMSSFVRFQLELEADGQLRISTSRSGELTLPVETLEAMAPGLARAIAISPIGELRRWTIAPELLQPGGGPLANITGPATAELRVVAGIDPMPSPTDLGQPPEDATTTASGLIYKRLSPAVGDDAPRPTAEDRVRVHYTGWRQEDGRMFDSSVMRGAPSVFPVGRLIAGWTEGLQLMAVGERFRFWIPGDLAYDNSTRPGAPRGTLVFDVELLEINPAN